MNKGDAIDVIACLNRSAFTHGKCDISKSNSKLVSDVQAEGPLQREFKVFHCHEAERPAEYFILCLLIYFILEMST